MKLITYIMFTISSLFFWRCKENKQLDNLKEKKEKNKIELNDNIEWEFIDDFLISTTQNSDLDLNSRKSNLINFINKNYPNFDSDFLVNENLIETKTEIFNWLAEIQKKEPLKPNIKSIYIGIFEEFINNKTSMTTYISGSIDSPMENEEWNLEQNYLPKNRYLRLKLFDKINNELQKYSNTSDIEQIIYNGLLNIIFSKYKNELESLFNKKIELGIGFDEGDCYLIK